MALLVVLLKLLYHSKYFVKYVLFALLFLFLCIILHLWSTRFTSYNYAPDYRIFPYNESNIGPRHILVWQHYYLMVNKGKQIFPSLQCKVNNCIFTEDRYLLGDYLNFDAIMFTDSALKQSGHLQNRPERRSPSQIYIFTSLESAYNIPACEIYNDNFFNWTFTYRLDSDIPWPYFFVRNVTRNIVAPSLQVNWTISKAPITKSIKNILQHKKKAAAWLVSHCEADSLRDDYISKLQGHLFHFSLKIDVYGGCTDRACDDENCEEMFSRDYYFYLAFENSFSVDYVSEKILHGYNNYVVPIVYGGADYTR